MVEAGAEFENVSWKQVVATGATMLALSGLMVKTTLYPDATHSHSVEQTTETGISDAEHILPDTLPPNILQWEEEIVAASEEFNAPGIAMPMSLYMIIESAGTPDAIGTSDGEYGLMQILPSNAENIGPKLGIEPNEYLDPEANLRMSAFLIRRDIIKALRQQAGAKINPKQELNLRRILAIGAGYNGGPARAVAYWQAGIDGIDNPGVVLYLDIIEGYYDEFIDQDDID